MEVVLVIASVLLLGSVAAAVALDRGPFAAPPARPGTAGPAVAPGAPPIHPDGLVLPAAALPLGLPPAAGAGGAAGRWASRDASVRACDDLQAELRAGRVSCAAYRKAMADMAASHDRRHPLPIPPEK
jgi:hypothetical protein